MLHILRKGTPHVLRNVYHFALAYMAAVVYGFPSRRLTVIGVTGTYGKSSVVMLLGRVLNDAGKHTGWFSTATINDGQREWYNALKMTMPGRFALQRFLRQCVRNGCTHAIIETSSQGITQHRHRGIAYDIAVLTNLSPEHLEAHGGFEAYRAAKAQLFAHTARQQRKQRFAIIPTDLPDAAMFVDHPFARVVRYPIDGIDLATLAPALRAFPANIAVVHAVAEVVGVDDGAVQQSLQRIPSLPGRLERIDEGQPFEVIVDYAFTPDALEAVYRFLGPPTVRTIHVLGGTGGGRDRWKYPVTGCVAAQHADVVIVTNEDPYDDDPAAIIHAVADGARSADNKRATVVEEILDRRDALTRAIGLAQPGDRILVTGKGCEQAICGPGGRKIPWDDRVVLRELLRRGT